MRKNACTDAHYFVDSPDDFSHDANEDETGKEYMEGEATNTSDDDDYEESDDSDYY